MTENNFIKLSNIDVNEHTDKKGDLTYLSWAWAWRKFKEACPEAKYEVIKQENGKPYYIDSCGAMVETKVTVGDESHSMWLPVMDYKNQTIKQPTMTDINKALMRCLTKNLAMFGLGLYIYAGEDLPEEPKYTPDDQINDWETIKTEIDNVTTIEEYNKFKKETVTPIYKELKNVNNKKLIEQIEELMSDKKQAIEATNE